VYYKIKNKMNNDVRGWFDERLDLKRFAQKFLRKAFPVHSSFFLGEIALFSFVILIITGLFLAFMYEPSTTMTELDGKPVPAAYASVVRIDRAPFGLIIRNIHHWAAHIMIASVILHLLRVFFTGAYKKPREINWIIGAILLPFTVVASFTGYLLPFDEFSVTATGIGYGIARSVPWIGPYVADLIFAGRFPAPGTIPRFYSFHVVLIPMILVGLIALHLLIMVKQKHSQPLYAKLINKEGRIIGVPLWPHQAIMSTELFLLLIGGLILIAGFFPVHPVQFYGPPRPGTPSVKPDWYFLWVYGLLKLIPGFEFKFLGTMINSENLGGVILPSLIILVLLLVPFLDRSVKNTYYLELPSQAPKRTAIGVGAIVFFLMLSLTGYEDVLKIPLLSLRIAGVLTPIIVGLIIYWSITLSGRFVVPKRRLSLKESGSNSGKKKDKDEK